MNPATTIERRAVFLSNCITFPIVVPCRACANPFRALSRILKLDSLYPSCYLSASVAYEWGKCHWRRDGERQHGNVTCGPIFPARHFCDAPLLVGNACRARFNSSKCWRTSPRLLTRQEEEDDCRQWNCATKSTRSVATIRISRRGPPLHIILNRGRWRVWLAYRFVVLRREVKWKIRAFHILFLKPTGFNIVQVVVRCPRGLFPKLALK